MNDINIISIGDGVLKLEVPNESKLIINDKIYIYRNGNLVSDMYKYDSMDVVWDNGCFYSKDEID